MNAIPKPLGIKQLRTVDMPLKSMNESIKYPHVMLIVEPVWVQYISSNSYVLKNIPI